MEQRQTSVCQRCHRYGQNTCLLTKFVISLCQGRLASNMFMAGSSYNFNLKNLSCNSQFIFNQYDIKDQFFGTNIHMSTYRFIHNMAFKNGMNWVFNGFYNTSKEAHAQDQVGYSLTETSIIKKKVIAGAELHYLTQGTTMSKTGGTLNVGVKLLKNINTQIKLTYNAITSPLISNGTETYGYLVVNLMW